MAGHILMLPRVSVPMSISAATISAEGKIRTNVYPTHMDFHFGSVYMGFVFGCLNCDLLFYSIIPEADANNN